MSADTLIGVITSQQAKDKGTGAATSSTELWKLLAIREARRRPRR